ncbi:MAG TPA: hypothetical protein PKD55_10940, partial [Bellilinea sp.]|nr:hypothetical protein [Bellilinea sp.]
PTTVTPEPTTVTPEPTTMTPEPTTVTPEPTTVIPEPTTVTPEPTTVTPEPTTVTPEPTTVTPEPTTATPEPIVALVVISKTDLLGTTELSGAILRVVSTDGTYDATLYMYGQTQTIALPINKTYILTEIRAPEGYGYADDITFRVTADKVVEIKDANGNWVSAANNTVQMKDPLLATVTPEPTTVTPEPTTVTPEPTTETPTTVTPTPEPTVLASTPTALPTEQPTDQPTEQPTATATTTIEQSSNPTATKTTTVVRAGGVLIPLTGDNILFLIVYGLVMVLALGGGIFLFLKTNHKEQRKNLK